MIISKIFQGLGNQFFQYAFGYARAKELGADFKIDTSYFEQHASVTQFGQTYTRDFGLNRFSISAPQATAKEIEEVLYPRGTTLMEKLFNRYRMLLAPDYHRFRVKEGLLQYNRHFQKILDNTYVEGYFTDERYFKPFRAELMREFTLVDKPSEQNLQMLDRIRQCGSVCISIRRTNFLNNPLHGTCGEDYYYNAMDVMASKIENPIFFVFSDDNEWVNRHFKSPYEMVLVQHNYPNFYEDFRLMVACRHHIIPNSTFPWWAAWLSDAAEKIVLAPKHWLKDTDIDFSDYVPREWIKLNHTIHTKFSGDN